MNLFYNKYYLSAITIIAVTMILIVLVKSNHLNSVEYQGSVERLTNTHIKLNIDNSVLDINNNEITSLNLSREDHNLLIIFTTDDCINCFSEVPFWNKIYSTYKEYIEISGVVYGNSLEKINYYANIYNIEIPLYYDFDKIILNEIGLTKTVETPIKILFSKEGEILYTQGATRSDRILQDQFESKLKSHIKLSK